jgi:hypothetical protein
MGKARNTKRGGGSVECYRISKPWEKGRMDVVVRKRFLMMKVRRRNAIAIAIGFALLGLITHGVNEVRNWKCGPEDFWLSAVTRRLPVANSKEIRTKRNIADEDSSFCSREGKRRGTCATLLCNAHCPILLPSVVPLLHSLLTAISRGTAAVALRASVGLLCVVWHVGSSEAAFGSDSTY